MPFYLRKSIKFGPLRINFSKSGLGASAGVTGLRVGTGSKGRYLHAGRGGLYFRRVFSSKEPEQAEFPDGAIEPPPLRDGLVRWIGSLLRGR